MGCVSAKPSAARSIEASPRRSRGRRSHSCRIATKVSAISRTSSIGRSPGSIGVLADGRRFVNEADGYYDYVAAMVRAVPEGQEVASWLILRSCCPASLFTGFCQAGAVPLAPYLRSGYLKKSGRTMGELARVCGGRSCRPQAYDRENTIGDARNGEDPVFGRGSTPYNRNGADPDQKPNPCVAPIEHGPFYAVKVLPGSFGYPSPA